MKKIMIAVALVCATTFTHAASITWGAAAGNPDWDPSAEGQWCYLLYNTSSGADAGIASKILIASEGIYGETLIGSKADNGMTIVAAHQLNAEEDEAGYFTDFFVRDDAKGGVNGYYQIVLADTGNQHFDARKADAVVTGIEDTTPGGGKAIYNTDFASDPWIGDSGFSGEFTVAPEPTSGLLLLLGVAGLALRRRRA